MIAWGVCLIVLALMAYVRLAPIDPAVWHQPIDEVADSDRPNGAVRIIAGGAGRLDQLNDRMLALSRTHLIAGSVENGRMTYVTRSKVFGFPDFTTIEASGDQIRLFARLKYGKSDLGVNRARLEGLIAGLQ
jgi:hypothetical protein